MQVQEPQKKKRRKMYVAAIVTVLVAAAFLGYFLYTGSPPGGVVLGGQNYILSVNNSDFQIDSKDQFNLCGLHTIEIVVPNPLLGDDDSGFCFNLSFSGPGPVDSVTATIMPGGSPLCQHLPANITCAGSDLQGMNVGSGLSFCLPTGGQISCGRATLTLCDQGACYVGQTNAVVGVGNFVPVVKGAVAGSVYVIELTVTFVGGHSSSLYIPVQAVNRQ